MRPPRRWTAALLLVAVIALIALIVHAGYLLRPDPIAIPVHRAVGPPTTVVASCDAPGVPPISVSATVLLSCPESFDGRRVHVQGEVIGDLLGRSARLWVLLNDDVYAWQGPLDSHRHIGGVNSGIAVLLPEGYRPEWLGGPGRWGDRIEVFGLFAQTSVEDDGGPAVIASEVRLLAEGGSAAALAVPRQRTAAMALIAVAAALALAANRITDVRRHGRDDA